MVESEALNEMAEAIDKEIERAVDEIIRNRIPSLDDYLDELDKGELEYVASGNVTIQFTPDHKVIASIPVEALEGYTWAFRIKNIEAEIDGTFEARLS